MLSFTRISLFLCPSQTVNCAQPCYLTLPEWSQPSFLVNTFELDLSFYWIYFMPFFCDLIRGPLSFSTTPWHKVGWEAEWLGHIKEESWFSKLSKISTSRFYEFIFYLWGPLKLQLLRIKIENKTKQIFPLLPYVHAFSWLLLLAVPIGIALPFFQHNMSQNNML